MRPDLINGLPAHPLFAHFIVVLAPLAAVLAVVAVLWPAANRRIGLLLPVLSVLVLALVPLTTHAGKWLKARTHPGQLLADHVGAGKRVLTALAALAVTTVLWWLLHHERAVARFGERAVRNAVKAVGALVVAAAVVAVAAVCQAGETGARSTWHNKTNAPVLSHPR